MRKVLNLLIILLLVSCSTKDSDLKLKKVIIAGKVLNPDPTIFKIDFSVCHIGIGRERISSFIDDTGYFKVSFDSYVPTEVWLLCKTNFLILTHPGDSIYVEFDGAKEERSDILKTVKFSGNSTNLNYEAAIFQSMYYSSNIYSDFDKKEQAIKDYDEVRYKHFRDSLKSEEENLLNSFIKQYKPSYETRNWAKIFLDIDYYRDLVEYPELHRIENNLKSKDWNVPITYYDFLKNQFSIKNSNLISGYSLESYANSYQLYLFEKIKIENKQFFTSTDTVRKYPEKLDSLMIFGTIKYTGDPILRQMVLTEMLRQRLEQSEIRMFNKYASTIEGLITEPYLKEPLFNLYRQTLTGLNNPKIASDAILNKLMGTSIKTTIDSIISVNKGKVIYMDCWATWCGPCIAEMPNSKKLMERYKAKDVAFIFICLDSEERNWKFILSKYSLSGQHFLLSKNQSSDFREAFDIKGVPHYILFDKKGDISENGASSPGFIKDKIDKLLTEK